MPAPYAQEFSPELGSQYLASGLNEIDQNEAVALGNVNAKRKAGGLDFQAAAGAEEGAIEAGVGKSRSDFINKYNMDVADKKYSERMTDESRAFQDSERQKTEDFQKSMTIMGYEHDNAMAAGEKHAAEQAALVGGAFGLAGSGVKAAGAAYGAGGVSPGGGYSSKVQNLPTDVGAGEEKYDLAGEEWGF